MKTFTYISVIALTAALSVPASADKRTINDVKRVSTFSATTIAGALAGGPFGMILGALGGAALAEHSKKEFNEKEALEMEVVELEQHVSNQEVAIVELQSSVAKKLEFQVMFPTGGDELSFQDLQRINSLAKYLKNNPQLKVRLDGHADPRGTDEYNNVLSQERAKSVAKALTDKGINKERIDVYSHGSNFATAIEKDRDQYAFERRVHIEVYNASSADKVAIN